MHWNQKYLLSHMLKGVALVRYLCGCPMLQAGGISLFGWERIHPDPTASPPSIILGSDTRLGGHGEKASPPPPWVHLNAIQKCNIFCFAFSSVPVVPCMQCSTHSTKVSC